MKGIYISWVNDPPNAKIKDWNVTELKVRVESNNSELVVISSW